MTCEVCVAKDETIALLREQLAWTQEQLAPRKTQPLQHFDGSAFDEDPDEEAQPAEQQPTLDEINERVMGCLRAPVMEDQAFIIPGINDPETLARQEAQRLALTEAHAEEV